MPSETSFVHFVLPLYGLRTDFDEFHLDEDFRLLSSGQDECQRLLRDEDFSVLMKLTGPSHFLLSRVPELTTNDPGRLLDYRIGCSMQLYWFVNALRIFKYGLLRHGNTWWFKEQVHQDLRHFAVGFDSEVDLTSGKNSARDLVLESKELNGSMVPFLNRLLGSDLNLQVKDTRIRVATHSFARSYRDRHMPVEVVLDLCICLDGLLAMKGEPKQVISKRTGNLLASQAGHANKAAELVKDFYGVRSDYVHSGHANEELVAEKLEEFRDAVRGVLLAMLSLSLTDCKQEVKQQLAEIDAMSSDDGIRRRVDSRAAWLLFGNSTGTVQ